MGEQETIYKSQAASRTVKELIPGIEFELIPKARHVTALAQPDIVNQRMLQFFAPTEQEERRPDEDLAVMETL